MCGPMSREEAEKVIARYQPGRPFTVGSVHAAELAEAYMVLGNAPIEQIEAMREGILGKGASAG